MSWEPRSIWGSVEAYCIKSAGKDNLDRTSLMDGGARVGIREIIGLGVLLFLILAMRWHGLWTDTRGTTRELT